MTELSFFADRDVDARTALARGAGAMIAAQPGRAVLYGAIVRDEALVLGRWQRRDDRAALRRATGGPAAYLGPGVLYLALGLPDASALMACPRERVLNRNVRGFLGGLSELASEPVLHFGREWLSRRTTPIALIAWHRDAHERVLLEVFASIGAPFAPPRDYRGHPPGSLAPQPLERMLEAVARGHASRFPGVAIAPADGPPAALEPPAERDEIERWSAAHEVPIGAVRAGVTLDAQSRIARARLAGDFYADEAAIDSLERELVGLVPDEPALGRAIDAALGPGRGVIEGVRSLRPILDALLDAAGHARTTH